MWIFCQQGAFSVTQHPKRRDNIVVAAWTRTDLEELKDAFSLLDRSPIQSTPNAEQGYRLTVQRWRWELLAAKLASDVTYTDLPGRLATIPSQRNKELLVEAIAHLMSNYQDRRHPKDPLEGHPRLFREAGDPLIDNPDEGWDADAHAKQLESEKP